jgi:membrane protease YdiL (CAAX protease family)
MQQKWGPLAASIGLGALYGLWHLPEFLEPDSFQNLMGMGFLFWFCIASAGNAIVMTWLYNRTGGSVLIAGFLYHGGLNFWGITLMTEMSLSGSDDFPPLNLDLIWVNTWVMAAVGLLVVILTRGRLGHPPQPAPPS